MKLTATVTMKDNSTFDVGFDADSVASAQRCSEAAIGEGQWMKFDNVYLFPSSAHQVHYSQPELMVSGVA